MQIEAMLTRWARWRRTDGHLGLGYPGCSAEQKQTRRAGGSPPLPDWDLEMRVESAMCQLREVSRESWSAVMALYEASREFAGLTSGQKARLLGVTRQRLYELARLGEMWLAGRLESA